MASLTVDQVRVLFVQEAEERLARLGVLLLKLEDAGGDGEIVHSVFREVHSLKGSAAVAGLPEVSTLAHELEELVAGLRSGERTANPEVIDILLAGADRLSDMILRPASADVVAPRDLAAPPADEAATTPPADGGNVPPPTRTLPAPVSAAYGVAPPGEDLGRVVSGMVSVPSERLEELIRLVGESASAHLRVGLMLQKDHGVDTASCAEFIELSRSLTLLQDRASRTQMVPVATVTDQLRRAVRDLGRAQGKDIRWDERGVDTELDRGVLRRLSDSLVHLVRNAVDHGIEPLAERLAAGKPAHGTISLHAMQLGSEVIIAVSDDGRGVDATEVRLRAERDGTDTEGMPDQQVLELIFRAGLSTKSFVTDVSGRGVGLDVVRSNVEAARGRVDVRSEVGVGTELRIIVPITLAVLRCLLVEAGGQRFALPFHRVVLTQAHHPDRVIHAEGRSVVLVDDQPVALSALAKTLGIGSDDPVSGPVVVVADTSRRHAFHVDRLVGQRDVVLKGLSRLVLGVPAVAGASVEPDGSIMLVLDPPGLIALAQRDRRTVGASLAVAASAVAGFRVLVVDDALTVRELQRSILERAGFDVRVAADGRQALAQLAEEPCDLVLTDVEMPIMDGIALTEAIRAAPALTNIPVLILTSLSSDLDRQRGLDAGADGYITKSGFDESTLLTAVNRLLGARA